MLRKRPVLGSSFLKMEQAPLERRYNLNEIIAILGDTPVLSPTQSSPSISNCPPISSPSNDSSGPPLPATYTRQKRQYCTWCGRGGHEKTDCTDLTVAFKLRVIRTRRGKICLIDGGKIPWPHGEKCLKDWVLKHGKSDGLEEYRRVGTTLRQEKSSTSL